MEARRRVLRTAVRERALVSVARRFRVLPRIDGFPLDVGSQLALIQVVDDFVLDGYAVFPVSHIRETWEGEPERFLKRVMSDTGQLRDRRKQVPVLSLDSWPAFFRSLAKHANIVVIECERQQHDAFHIGPIVGVAEHAVGVHHITCTATWERAPRVVPIEHVTRVLFGNHYTSVFAHYAWGEVPSKPRKRRT